MTHSNPHSATRGKPASAGFAHVAIVGKYQGVGTGEALAKLARFLDQRGHHVYIEEQTAQNTGLNAYPVLELTRMAGHCDVALVVGGDGTMLGAGRELARQSIPVIGINQGRLGFITDISLEGYEHTLAPMLDGAYEAEHRSMMHAGIWRAERCEFWAEALNDVVINRGSMGGMIELRVAVGGHLVANQRADGLIIATPTGSTAYALSAGGPIVHPSINGWVLAPIAPHTLSNRPIVLPSLEAIDIEVVAARDASAHFDMQSFTSLLPGDHVRVSRSEHSLQLLHPQGWNYFDTLRKKLHWNEGLPSY
jgi:NAD+ kinase